MELYQLENFIAVVEEHSFTRAADRVLRTQAAVSVAIRKLEEELGVPLVTRDSRECTLTEAGHVMLTYARRIIQARDEMQHCLAEFTSLGTGRVKIAAHESAAQYLLPAPLAAFHVLHPKIKIVTRLCDVQEIAQLVASREVDLGFGIKQANLRGLRAEVVYSDPLVMVVGPGHRLAHTDVVRIEELGNEHFVLHHLQTQTTDLIQHLFAERRTPFDVSAELWNFETVKHFVRAGDGIAIIPMSVAQADLEAGRLLAVGVQDMEITRSIEVIYRDEDRLLPAPLQLLEIIRSHQWDQDVSRPRTVPLRGRVVKTQRRQSQ